MGAWYIARFAVLVAMLLASARPVAAQDDWELLPSYPDAAYQLWAHRSGAIFALGQNAEYRSDDLGETWQALAVPPGGHVTAIDPSNDQILYARAGDESGPGAIESLERSDDGGASWRTLLSFPASYVSRPARPLQGYPPQTFAVSPTMNQLLYAFKGEQLVHSRDGGATWQQMWQISHVGSPCSPAVGLLAVDPQDPRRVFTDAGCYAGRDFGTRVAQSFDEGATWSPFFDHGRGSDPATPSMPRVSGYPRFLVGGNGRWYLALDPFLGSGPARLFRSDDDGAHWTPIWDTGTAVAASGGLAFDPNEPDTVYVAVGVTADPSATGVQLSQDAGQTWCTVGSPAIGWVHDLARSADGSALFAATNEGIWRLQNQTCSRK